MGMARETERGKEERGRVEEKRRERGERERKGEEERRCTEYKVPIVAAHTGKASWGGG